MLTIIISFTSENIFWWKIPYYSLQFNVSLSFKLLLVNIFSSVSEKSRKNFFEYFLIAILKWTKPKYFSLPNVTSIVWKDDEKYEKNLKKFSWTIKEKFESITFHIKSIINISSIEYLLISLKLELFFQYHFLNSAFSLLQICI